MKPLTFKTYTFGCRVNQAETIGIEENLQKAEFKPTTGDKPPDIVIVNTCVVTKKAEKEVKQLARRARRENPNCFLILCGCGVNFWQRTGFPNLPVDLWIKNEQKEKLAQILKKINHQNPRRLQSILLILHCSLSSEQTKKQKN